jgi:hypothetical protein
LASQQSALADYQILQNGTLEAELRPLVVAGGMTGSVLVCCDRPTLFFLDGERLEMQYMRENTVNQASVLRVANGDAAFSDLVVYENSDGKVSIGSIEPQSKLQTRRVGFRKQVSKTIMIHGQELILANIEEPDYGYLDPSKPEKCNLIALLSKRTFKTLDVFGLDRMEVANCVVEITKRIQTHQSHVSTVRNQELRLILVGTAYLDAEAMPSRGRLLVFSLDVKDYKLSLIKKVDLQGSI